jgi:hypothetical protein
MHIEYVSNGQGSQSTKVLIDAAHRRIPATVCIAANTGSENDRLWSTGERTTSEEYFERVTKPYAEAHGIPAYFVKARDKGGAEVTLRAHTLRMARAGRPGVTMPLFSKSGSRLGQTCTDRFKLAAVRQQLRRLGAKTAAAAIGIHAGEAWRRTRGVYLYDFIFDPVTGESVRRSPSPAGDDDPIDLIPPRPDNCFSLYQTCRDKKGRNPIKWMTHYYPLADMKLSREDCQRAVEAEGLPYLISSECDECPHQDADRWLRHTPEKLAELAEYEAEFKGEFFFTEYRLPLAEAVALMRSGERPQPLRKRGGEGLPLFPVGDQDFGCKSGGICGI